MTRNMPYILLTTLQDIRSELVTQFARDAKDGLSSASKYLNPKYFYDRAGSLLFEEICRQPEYYLTKTEAAILKKYSPDIANKHSISVVELGSGNSTKTEILLKQMSKRQSDVYYFPIDIAQDALRSAAERISAQFPNVHTTGIVSDYAAGLEAVNEFISTNAQVPDRKMILFLGSSIGNFDESESRSFLQNLRKKMNSSDVLLVGFDLHKDSRVLNAAYNDRAGVTARFNLNILARINRELGGNFDPEQFDHCAFYNKEKRRIEMHLVSKTSQTAHVSQLGHSFSFQKGETIRTENSYKFTLEQIERLAGDSGFKVKRNFMDRKKWFALSLMSPA